MLALDEQAEALRLKPGMGIADARAMHPFIDVVEADPPADARLVEALADWCDRYTPLVAVDAPDGLFLDITGCAHLFGGETAMRTDLLERLSDQGFKARAGLAATPGAAWAAARFDLSVLASGEEAQALGPLPLAALRLDPATCAGLESVGLRSVGLILAAPRAPLARRFGSGLLARLDQALGRVEEAISPRLPVPPLSAERRLAEPVGLVEEIERLLRILAVTLRQGLEARGEGARRLQLSLFRIDGAVTRIAVGASQPMRDPSLVARLFHERFHVLEGMLDPGYGYDLIRLSVLAAAPFGQAQGDLAGRAADREEDLALFADRVIARLGERSIRRPALVASHLPERAVALGAFAGAAISGNDAAPPLFADRPIRLLRQPEPVEVTAEIPEGPPAQFRWRRASYRVAAAEGPERIAPEWWLEKKEGLSRDYYRVEDGAGRRFWLYREGFYDADEAPPRWFMQGVFA